MPEPYSTAHIPLGYVNEVLTHVVYVPRADFMQAIDHVESRMRHYDWGEHDDDLEAKLAELRTVAKTMPRFPLSNWIDETRGCGCVVGEYLVAHDLVTREAAVEAAQDGRPIHVEDLLAHQPFGAMLEDYGMRIDDQAYGLAGRASNWGPVDELVFID